MTTRAVSVLVEPYGGRATRLTEVQPEDIRAILEDLRDARDVFLQVTAAGLDGRLMIGLDAGAAFLAWDRDEALLQFVCAKSATGKRSLLVGGVETNIDTRYVTDIERAATVTVEWVTDTSLSTGCWGR